MYMEDYMNYPNFKDVKSFKEAFVSKSFVDDDLFIEKSKKKKLKFQLIYWVN